MTFDELQAARPDWHLWRGLAGGLVYASKLKTSPPVIKRAPTVENLEEQIKAEMRYREERFG